MKYQDKAIIFDFDGVIHDTFDLAYKINVEIYGEKLSKEDYRDFFNGNIYKNKQINKDASERYFSLQNEKYKYLEVDENIKKNIKRLAEDYEIFIISSNQEEALNNYFQNNKFAHVFREVLGLETHKSKVEKFKYLFKKYNLKAEDCVFVTDTLGDILEGNKIGVRTIAVDFGFHKRDRLEKGNPFKIVSSFDEIIKTIKNT